MTGFSRWTVMAAFAIVACGGGGSGGADIAGFFPTEAELTALGGWTEDPAAPGLEISSPETAEHGTTLDGAVVPFSDHGLVQVARAFYVKSASSLELRIWQMPDATAAQTVYDKLRTASSSVSWEDVPNVGDTARITSIASTLATPGYFWLVTRVGAYYLDLRISPNDDEAARADVIAFAQAVAGKIP